MDKVQSARDELFVINRHKNLHLLYLLTSSSRLLDIRTLRLVIVGDCSFSTGGQRLWNSLPQDVQSVSSLTIFSPTTETVLISAVIPGHYSVAVSL